MTDNQYPTDDAEAEAKARWLAQTKDEVAPQVDADPSGVAEAVEHRHGAEHEADFETVKTKYRAIISAHFADEATAERAVAQINSTELPERSYLQVYREGDPHIETELAEGETIIILQVGEGESDHDALVRMITEAGGTKVNYTPPQSLINAGIQEP